MAAIRSAGTSPERRLRAALRTMFPRRRIVERPDDLPGRPDFYLPGLKLAIFADGCFWHRCPTHGRVPGTTLTTGNRSWRATSLAIVQQYGLCVHEASGRSEYGSMTSG